MVIVVEGKNDYNKIKSVFPDADVIITNGSAVNQELLDNLKQLSKRQEIVLCLDPDFPGLKIRNAISSYIPEVKHVYANQKDAISANKKKVGIEHMLKKDIIDMFSSIKFTKSGSDIMQSDLLNLGLIGEAGSRAARAFLCEELKIGYCNSKTLLNRLNMYGYTLSEVRHVYDSR